MSLESYAGNYAKSKVLSSKLMMKHFILKVKEEGQEKKENITK